MPTKTELIAELGALLQQAGVQYASAGARDKHYAVWVFSVAFDEARAGHGAALLGVSGGPEAVFRGKPSDLDSPVTYTYARAGGARRDWEIHVDVNLIGSSGAAHGVDVSVVVAKVADDARRDGRPPRLSTQGLGLEAKCFSRPLSPNEGRITLGFQVEMDSMFWLVANTRNAAVETMLRRSGRKTDFFGEARPGSVSERDLRTAVAGHLNT